MKKVLTYLLVIILFLISAALGVLSVILYSNQQTLNTKVDLLNQQLESEKALNKTLQTLVDSKTSTTPSSSGTTNPPAATTKIFTSSHFDMKFNYPIAYGDAKSELSQGIEYVSFTGSEVMIHFPSSEGGFDPEGYNVEVVKSKDSHDFSVYTLKQVIDDPQYRPSVSSFYSGTDGIVSVSSAATKATYTDITNQIKDIIKSMAFTNAAK